VTGPIRRSVLASLPRPLLARGQGAGGSRFRGQDGYLLIYVMGIIGLTSVLVIALIGLALTSARVAAMEARVARETRAADGAIEAQIAAISSRGGAICNTPGPVDVADPSVRGGAVRVDCTTSGVSNPGQRLPGPDVQIVGTTDYAGAITPTMAGATDPSLVVDASTGAARFDSDVLVARGASVARSSGTPAVEVAGQYEQGSVVGGTGCGALDSSAPNRIADEGGVGAPSCGSVPTMPVAVPSDVSGLRRPTTGRDFSCAPGGVVTLAPGTYSAADIHALNMLVTSPSTLSCTIVLQPGVHYLDVYDPSKVTASRNLLEVSNPNIRVIGGDPVGDPAAAPFPYACQTGTAARGVQVVLSPRSAIRHSAGRVALCPDHVIGPGGAAGALPVLSQSSITDSQPVLTGWSATGFANPAGLNSSTDWAETTQCWWDLTWWGFVANCAERAFQTTWASSGSGALASARVLLDVRQRPVPITNIADTAASYHASPVEVRFKITNGAVDCTTDWQPAGRSWAQTMSYDLLGSSECRSELTQQEQLNGATVQATFRATPAGTGLLLSARNMRIETNSFTLDAAAVGTSDPQWSNVAGALRGSDSNSSASVSQPPVTSPITIPVTYWEDAARVTRSFTLTDFTLPAGLLPTDRVTRLGVLLRGPTNEISYLADPIDGGSMTATLTTADGSTCTASTPSYGQSGAYVRYDLISGSCASKVITADQLDDAQLQVSITTGCTVPSAPFPPAGTCSSVGIPKVDHLALSVGTDTYHGPTPYSSVTSSAFDQTSFDVFGPALMPTADLDINWNGVPDVTRPLFDGPLQVHGLGVRQAASAAQGTICCVIDNTAAVLVASVDGDVRAQSAIRVDTGVIGSVTNRRPVEILSWQLCGRNGC